MEREIKTLVFNLMCDLKKKEVEPKDRATLIRKYMDSEGLSARQMAITLGMPHSTVQDWLLWDKVSITEYDNYKDQGFTDKDIYRSLRGGTLSGTEKEIDLQLKNCISKLEVFKIKPPYSKDTKVYIDKLKHILEVIERQVK